GDVEDLAVAHPRVEADAARFVLHRRRHFERTVEPCERNLLLIIELLVWQYADGVLVHRALDRARQALSDRLTEVGSNETCGNQGVKGGGGDAQGVSSGGRMVPPRCRGTSRWPSRAGRLRSGRSGAFHPCLMNVPLRSSPTACCSSACVF